MSNLLISDKPVQRSNTVYNKSQALGDSPDKRFETSIDAIYRTEAEAASKRAAEEE